MKKYVWSYKATVHGGKGLIKGRVEAATGFEAERLVKDDNLMVDSVEVKLVRNAKVSEATA